MPWYYRWAFIVVALICFFPIGLLLLWLSPHAKNAKWITTGAVVASLVVGGVATSLSPTEDTVGVAAAARESTTSTAPSTTQAPTTTEATTTAPPPPPTTTAPLPPPTTTAPPPPPPPPVNLELENAKSEAQDYLDYSAFSRQGLIEQLSSEYGAGYPLNIATEAVDSLNVDWNAQAVKSAHEYLEFSPFSRQALIEQLSSPYGAGFTYDQAVFGVNATGL